MGRNVMIITMNVYRLLMLCQALCWVTSNDSFDVICKVFPGEVSRSHLAELRPLLQPQQTSFSFFPNQPFLLCPAPPSPPLTLPFGDTFPYLEFAKLLLALSPLWHFLCLQGLPPPLTCPDLHLASSCSSFTFHLLSVWRWNSPAVYRVLDTRGRSVSSDIRVDDEYTNKNNWIRSGVWKTHQSRAVRLQSGAPRYPEEF